MPQRTLMIVLGLCAAIGLWPVLPWLLAFAVDSMDDGWLGPMAVTIPIGMGLGALALAWHGLLLQRELVDSLEEDFAQSLDDFVAAGLGRQVPVGAAATSVAARPATSRATSSTATAGNGAATEARVASEEAGGAGGGKVAEAGTKAKDAAKKAGKQAGTRVVRRAKSRTKNAARRGVRGLFRDITPKF